MCLLNSKVATREEEECVDDQRSQTIINHKIDNIMWEIIYNCMCPSPITIGNLIW